MEKCKLLLVSSSLLLLSSVCQAVPAAFEVGESGVFGGQVMPLSPEEMARTKGEFIQIPFVAIAGIFAGGVTVGVGNAIGQYQDFGTVNLGEVALAGAAGAGIAAVNIAAVATGSVVAITTAVGLDIAVTAAMAFAGDYGPYPQPAASSNVTLYPPPGAIPGMFVDGVPANLPGMLQLSSGVLGMPPPILSPSYSLPTQVPDMMNSVGAGEEQYLYF